ncbi:MAG: DegT/DnrJ/EryC1/StrS family aminotransferase, partial [Candidatus Latescibacteria bacterium]|nr:DegT/DnrJ/EryC1/StrS family aminotransferase [Candidatus Latescibacterota bacterium]
NSEELFDRAFAIHDQGHLPNRHGVEMGARTVIGLDFRMTELSAAVLLVQLKKMDMIKSELKKKKKRFKDGINDLKGINFRTLPDPDGELGTLLTVLFPDETVARSIGKELGSGVVADSGWHVYNNMEHILGRMVVDNTGCPFNCPIYKDRGGAIEYSKGMLPKTDSILGRAINISIGVSDAGLGSGFGITITSSNTEIDQKIDTFRRIVEKHI